MTAPLVVAYNQADGCTLSGGTWSTTLPLAKLQTGDSSELARSLHGTHGSTCFKVTGGIAPARVFSVGNHNLVGPLPTVSPSETTQFRVRTIFGSYASAATFNPRSSPVAILASTNLTGAVTALQGADLENPPGTWLTATVPTSDTNVRVSMQGATCGLLVGSNVQGLLVLLRRTGAGEAIPP